MKRVAVILVVAFVVLSAFAQGRLTWLSTEHDFGTINEEEGRVSCVMQAVNTGDSAMVLTDVVSTCGCTAREFSHETIMPGDTAWVKITYIATGRPGDFKRTVFVYASSFPHRTPLTVKGTVIGSPNTIATDYPVVVGSLRLNVGSVPFGEMTQGKVKIAYINGYNAGQDSLQVTFSNVPEHVKITALPKVVPPGGICSITTFFVSEEAPLLGYNEDKIKVESQSEVSYGLGSITVTGVVKEDFSRLTNEQLQAAPKAVVRETIIDFNKFSPSAQLKTVVKIANAGESTLDVRRLYADDAGISARMKKTGIIKPGKSGEIEIIIDANAIKGTYLNSKLHIITNDPINPVHDIRLVGIKQ